MKLTGIFLLATLLLTMPLRASESYVIVRLLDAGQRSFVTRTGAVEVQHPDLRTDEVLVYATDDQLEELRNEANVALIYPASTELIAGVPVHSCAPPESELLGEYIMSRGRGWGLGIKTAVRLTYSVETVTPKLGRERLLEQLDRALKEWSRYVQVDFDFTNNHGSSRNLNILFASGAHGDPYPFDGRGRTLAHTFYPADINPEPIAGDLHFDEDENWHTGVSPDFFSVALHELGHALGLAHSDRPNAVMYPYYRRFEKLQADDIAAIRRLYAQRNETSPGEGSDKPSESAPPPEEKPLPAEAKPSPANSDKAPPALKILFPATTLYSTSAATLRLSGTANDNVEIASVTWTGSGGRSGVATGTTTWTIPEFPLRLGDNRIVITATDAAGNTTWRNLTITRR